MENFKISLFCPEDIKTEYEDIEYPIHDRVKYYSNITKCKRTLNVLLPLNYTDDKKYPVLYLLHGLFCDEDTMLDEDIAVIPISTNLAIQGKAKEMIIVFPNEYVPKNGISLPPEPTDEYFEGYDNFINELVDNIMPFIESKYSVAKGRENTAIAGFSMGGRNSLYIGFKRPDLFGYIGAFSPAPGVIPGKDKFHGYHKGLFTKEDDFRTSPQPIINLISCGTDDTVVNGFPKHYHEVLTRNQQKHIWYEVPDANHDFKSVCSGLYNFILTLFGALN
ncbi:alpha/beta-hydrolase [Anaeromyces robustus]|uniref:Alpha/beta-hydrolase n=1 Tax=Anaeromyces robustus TaxID=1754192 RepID=A0A1Y1X348_9FUNG|nr:alpha/beta-hydrolase [Anaeromyces robustus]|eukprot:ORX80058.1 alpha/beta-hydrolase [Anaeromyces robustus]